LPFFWIWPSGLQTPTSAEMLQLPVSLVAWGVL